MFDKFGEFASIKELNRAAAAQKAEGDLDALIALAEENGLDKEDAEDYMEDVVDELATPLMAAVGKLKVEKKEYGLKGILLEWADDLAVMCTKNDAMCAGVREKGRGLDGYIALLAEIGYENRAMVDRRIVKKTKTIRGIVGNHEFSIGVPDRKARREIAEAYYLGEKR